MKVVAYYKKQTKHILVLDDLKEEIGQDDFFFEIAGVYKNLEILFVEYLILPVKIIKALEELKEKYTNDNFRIHTTTEFLSQYLFDLGIPNSRLKTSKNLNKKECEVPIDFSDEELKGLLVGIYNTYGYDFLNYQFVSIKRIILQTMNRESILDFKVYETNILQDHESFQRLFLNLSVNVTSFFRNPELFKTLKNEVLPYLDSFPHLRIWSVGTASGEEAYSLAILLDELNLLEKSIIYATDFNSLVLQKAQNGLYALSNLKQAVENYSNAGGLKRLEDYFDITLFNAQIKPHIKQKVVFFQHNLTSDKEFNEFHLILCKNVLIYFNSQLKEGVIKLFQKSLHRNGFLVLGRSENLYRNSQEFFKYKAGLNIFKQHTHTQC